MKRIVVALFCLVAAFALAGCGPGDESELAAEPATEVTETSAEETKDVTEATEAPKSEASFEDFRKMMDDYEDFMDSYCELMKKYNSDPATYMDEYLEMNQKYIKVMGELDALDDDELTDEEMEYYLEVMNRINTNLAEIAY